MDYRMFKLYGGMSQYKERSIDILCHAKVECKLKHFPGVSFLLIFHELKKGIDVNLRY